MCSRELINHLRERERTKIIRFRNKTDKLNVIYCFLLRYAEIDAFIIILSSSVLRCAPLQSLEYRFFFLNKCCEIRKCLYSTYSLITIKYLYKTQTQSLSFRFKTFNPIKLYLRKTQIVGTEGARHRCLLSCTRGNDNCRLFPRIPIPLFNPILPIAKCSIN